MPVVWQADEDGAEGVTVLGQLRIVTMMLCSIADRHKLPIYIIYKRKTLPAKEAFPRDADTQLKSAMFG